MAGRSKTCFPERRTIGQAPAETWPSARCGLAGGAAARLVAAVFADVAAVLGQVLDALAGGPLGVVVLQRVDQLPHEPRRRVHAGHHDPRDLVLVNLVIEAR